jgi:hypothetical protein
MTLAAGRRHQPGMVERSQMVRQGGGRDIQRGGDVARRHPFRPGRDKAAEHGEPRFMSKRGKGWDGSS